LVKDLAPKILLGTLFGIILLIPIAMVSAHSFNVDQETDYGYGMMGSFDEDDFDEMYDACSSALDDEDASLMRVHMLSMMSGRSIRGFISD